MIYNSNCHGYVLRTVVSIEYQHIQSVLKSITVAQFSDNISSHISENVSVREEIQQVIKCYEMSEFWRNLAKKCLSVDPSLRPSAAEIQQFG